MQTIQQFCLRWNNHQPNFISVFTALLTEEALVDVTLACEGKFLQAHRVVLSACSAYFQSLFTVNPCQHPIVILKDIKFKDLRTMVDFMYHGEVNVSQEQLPAILKIAEMLKIKGLADMPGSGSGERTKLLTPQQGDAWRRSASPLSPITRRKRLRRASTGSGSGSTEQTSEEVIGESTVKIERVESEERSRLAHDPSTDSEPREPDNDAHTEPRSRSPSIRRHGSSELRQLSHDSRQSSINDERKTDHDRHKPQERQASHESRLSHDSSIDSVTTDIEATASPGKERIGTKRGRLLMRQQRVKKEIDTHTSPDSEPGSPGFPRQRSESGLNKSDSTSENNASIGVLRQRSEPAAALSPITTPLRFKNESTLVHNLLAVPQTTYPTRQVSLGTRAPARSSQSVEESGPNTLVVIDSLPIVRIIPDEKHDPEPLTPLTPQTPIAATNSAGITASEPSRSGHCPLLRDGPALGCNYCWNSIDDRGRILRRKTKYHCPDCQTNLCIVPCFQLYHQETLSSSSSSGQQTSASLTPSSTLATGQQPSSGCGPGPGVATPLSDGSHN